MTNWKDCTLGDVLTLQRGFDLPVQERSEGLYPVVASNGVIGKHSSFQVAGPGVVIGRSGSVGGGQFIRENFWPLNTTLWVKDFKGNDPRYCYYLLKSIDLASFNVGGAVPTLNRNHLHPLQVSCPGYEEQRQISTILGMLDDKIQLGWQINETLDAIAKAIFRDWFVDFGPTYAKLNVAAPYLAPDYWSLFPARLDEKGVPIGWGQIQLKSLASVISKGSTPTKPEIAAARDSPTVPFIKVKDINSIGVIEIDDLEHIPASVHERSLKRSILRAGDVLFTIAGTIGRVAVVPEELDGANINQAVAFIRLKCPASHSNLIYQTLREGEVQQAAEQAIVQGVQANLSLGSLGDLLVPLPSPDILNAWNSVQSSIQRRQQALHIEARTLASIRDLLLPKLMSGEIRVKHAEQAVEAVA